MNKTIYSSARKIKVVLFDVDGVLTDGGIIYDNSGMEYKRFHVRDGQIIRFLKESSITVGAITGRNSVVVKNRCEELKLDFHFHGVKNKLDTFKKIKLDYKVSDEEICFIGDDVIDLPILTRVGFSATPADAPDYMDNYVDYRCIKKGGYGVLREVADLILLSQGKLHDILERMAEGGE
ncbi:KdsC family phosphatase [Marinigracilibium pacificum]|uniref:3-deoxy-manno-octulosonate-8-phosphatase n=1 Tax=Marinigracilibium pacificum TaxID=2729599 RepID=A0A848IU90_9BACT|nr:3-deoxy-manno-octulosonate-8-phosphatase [Marinigracilibium pacificum]NMM48063.1 3-deoxy-manno-octulosonate-8-phosphatase [Marinigracilibium pacificum]